MIETAQPGRHPSVYLCGPSNLPTQPVESLCHFNIRMHGLLVLPSQAWSVDCWPPIYSMPEFMKQARLPIARGDKVIYLLWGSVEIM